MQAGGPNGVLWEPSHPTLFCMVCSFFQQSVNPNISWKLYTFTTWLFIEKVNIELG